MYLSVLIFGLVLLPQVHNLQCLDCIDNPFGSCSTSTSECPSGSTQCGTMRTVTYAGSTELADITVKSCTLAEQCGVISANFGIGRTVVNTKCCDTDLCNNGTAPEITMSSPNGKKCFTCEGQDCTSILECEGNEDHCITASVAFEGTEQSVKGCGSKQLCAEDSQLAGTFGRNLRCCEGNLCNGSHSVAAGLLLLMTSLCLVLFS